MKTNFEEIIVENFPNVGKEMVNQAQEVQRVLYRINPRRNMLTHILIKLTKNKLKERISVFSFPWSTMGSKPPIL